MVQLSHPNSLPSPITLQEMSDGSPNAFSWEALNGGKAFEHIGWHPGPGAHALRGHILAFHYLTALELALALTSSDKHMRQDEDDHAASRAYGIRQDGSKSDRDLFAHTQAHLQVNSQQKVIAPPSPLFCAAWLCERMPRCASTYVPHEGRGLGARMADASLASPEPLRLEKRGRGGIKHKLKEEDVGEYTDDDGIGGGGGDGGKWRHVLLGKTRAAVRTALEQHRGYLDRKYVLQSGVGVGKLDIAPSSRIAFLLERETPLTLNTEEWPTSLAVPQFVCLCNPWTSRAPPGWSPLSADSIRVWVNGTLAEPLSQSDASPLSEGPCILLALPGWRHQQRPMKGQVSRSAGSIGVHVNGLQGPYRVEVEPAAPKKYVTISHVLWM